MTRSHQILYPHRRQSLSPEQKSSFLKSTRYEEQNDSRSVAQQSDQTNRQFDDEKVAGKHPNLFLKQKKDANTREFDSMGSVLFAQSEEVKLVDIRNKFAPSRYAAYEESKQDEKLQLSELDFEEDSSLNSSQQDELVESVISGPMNLVQSFGNKSHLEVKKSFEKSPVGFEVNDQQQPIQKINIQMSPSTYSENTLE